MATIHKKAYDSQCVETRRGVRTSATGFMLEGPHLMKRTKMVKSNTFHMDMKYNEMPDSLKSAISSCRI